MGIIGNVTLQELLFEIGYTAEPDALGCGRCKGNTRWEIEELHPQGFKVRCAGCGSSWSGKRRDMLWNIKGFDSMKTIYDRNVRRDIDTLQSQLQDLAMQHLTVTERRHPHLWEIQRDHTAERLIFMCGGNPHYIAITIDEEPAHE